MVGWISLRHPPCEINFFINDIKLVHSIMNETFPDFEVAVQRLRAFLVENEWPSQITWVKETDIKPLSPKTAQFSGNLNYSESDAKTEYERAVKKGLGVALEGLAATKKESFVAVTWPCEAEEAEQLMYSDSGIKFTVLTRRPRLIK